MRSLFPAGRLLAAPLLVVLVAFSLAGCAAPDFAPAGFGIVREHIIFASRNDPPILSTYDLTIVSVDGQPPQRESLPRLTHDRPGVQMPAGTRRIVARVSPHLRPAGHVPEERTFDLTVESGKAYYLFGDEAGRVQLVEVRR